MASCSLYNGLCEEFFVKHGISATVLSKRDTIGFWAEWISTYGRGRKRKYGKCLLGNSQWEALHTAKAVRGADAQRQLLKTKVDEFYLLSSDPACDKYLCSGTAPHNILSLVNMLYEHEAVGDVYFADVKQRWTYVASHEDVSGSAGPYFALAEDQIFPD